VLTRNNRGGAARMSASRADQPDPFEPLIPTKQAARMLSVTAQWLEERRWRRRDGPRWYKVGGRVGYKRSDLLKYLESCLGRWSRRRSGRRHQTGGCGLHTIQRRDGGVQRVERALLHRLAGLEFGGNRGQIVLDRGRVGGKLRGNRLQGLINGRTHFRKLLS